MGWYHVRSPTQIEIYPGSGCLLQARTRGASRFPTGKVSQIISCADNTARTEYPLEPELITNLFDRNREKRRLVQYEDIPPVLVHAVVSAEDKRFFQHSGFDPLRIMKSVYVDLKERLQRRRRLHAEHATGPHASGWTRSGRWRRKIPRSADHLAPGAKLTKEQIFEYYANKSTWASAGVSPSAASVRPRRSTSART